MTPTLKTPTEWATLSGIRIIDIDGWRPPEEKDFSLPVTKEEFDQRIVRCMVQIVDWDKFRNPMIFSDGQPLVGLTVSIPNIEPEVRHLTPEAIAKVRCEKK